MNPRSFLIFILLLILYFSLVTSCSTNRGRIKQGRGGEIQSADIIAHCKEPRKTYAKEIEASLKAEIDKLRRIPNARLEAELRNKVIRLSDYSTKGLDLDLLLFRICEMSLNRGFTNDQTSRLIEIAIEAWSEKQKEEPGDDYPEFKLLRNTPVNSNLIIGFYFMLKIHGKNPLKEFKIRTIDIQDFRIKSSTVYHTDLQLLDLNLPTPYVTDGKLDHPNLVYKRDFGELKPAKNYVLPDNSYKSPLVVLNAIPLDKNLPFQGFNIYCESAHKYWLYEIRFITKGGETEWAIQQHEISENNEWKFLDSESDISKGYNLLDEDGNPIFYGK